MSQANIEIALDIQVEKSGKKYRADACKLPGSPPVGIGKTKIEAKYNLLVNLLYQRCCDLDFAPHIQRHISENFESAVRS